MKSINENVKDSIQYLLYGTMLSVFALIASCSSKKDTETKTNPLIQFTGLTRVESGDDWKAVETKEEWKATETAIVICDMWDEHWCKGATQRVGQMAPKINKMITLARQNGVTIIHAPSDVIEYYEGTPQRERLKNVSIATWAKEIPGWYHLDSLKEAPLPIDDSDGGCDDFPKCQNRKAWSKQISTINIDEQDGISDNGQEILSYFEQKGIKNVILCGVHANMCVLGRSFGVRSQVTAGLNVTLARDLTDAMYNHEMSPFVSHKEGTQKVIEHIEKYWASSVLSDDLMKNWK
ncbi:protein-signal peptide and transmembrane prediction [Reichenbachiella sp. MALMAid0571]|uniref:protein-signal peptide and transmembrane prediction n=1 Tax=Reichenbachiella sp. MALMAid0571 TaxID=3143939 RepID=UPI0032E01DE4